MNPYTHNQFQHIRHSTPSASPPIPNGMPFHHRGPSPQPPHGISRPSSAAHIRRTSSNLVPQQYQQHSQGPPPPNSYAYMPNPPFYNPQAAQGPMPPKPPQPPHQPQHQFTHPPPTNNQLQQAYLQEQRRQSMPPTLPEESRQQSVPVPSPPQAQENNFQSPPLPQPKPLPAAARSHSIFTPIDDSRSLLAQHWGSTSSRPEPPKSEAPPKAEMGPRSQSIDVAAIQRAQVNGYSPPESQPQPPPPRTEPPRTASTTSVPSFPPPSRTNSIRSGADRPRLKVQIPSEHSDAGSATAESSPKDTGTTPARGSTEASHSSGVVLPPPSPSASALLSAGASGPPNPFARPAPPVKENSFGQSDRMETPISALPSRFMSDQLLPSPSSFYPPEWGFGRDSGMLPSPLNFQTPIVTNGPSFRDDDDRKRKTSEGSEGGMSKKLRT